MKSTLVVTCHRCGQEYIATADMIVAGIWQRACPVCYPPHTDDEPPQPAPVRPDRREAA